MSNEIPKASREIVRTRDRDMCLRCGSSRGGMHWHHRRSRRVRDGHTHCACVGVTLCSTCHDAVHASPRQSMEDGWIVSSYQPEPWTVPVRKRFGDLTLACDGTATWHVQDSPAPI